jgi:hypothetical protein
MNNSIPSTVSDKIARLSQLYLVKSQASEAEKAKLETARRAVEAAIQAVEAANAAVAAAEQEKAEAARALKAAAEEAAAEAAVATPAPSPVTGIKKISFADLATPPAATAVPTAPTASRPPTASTPPTASIPRPVPETPERRFVMEALNGNKQHNINIMVGLVSMLFKASHKKVHVLPKDKSIFAEEGERRNACKIVCDIFYGFSREHKPWHTKIDDKFQLTSDGRDRLNSLILDDPSLIDMFGWFCTNISERNRNQINNQNEIYGSDRQLNIQKMTIYI